MIHQKTKYKNAGCFSLWLNELIGGFKGCNSVTVPCDDCVACCTSSYFIHIRPSDRQTLQHVPKEIVFPAPGLPEGHKVLGFDQNGHCPMFNNGKCTIYSYRPQTCRQYDCRIYPATGLSLRPEDRPRIARQAMRWRFDFCTKRDHEKFSAVQAAARFLIDQQAAFPKGFIPIDPTQQAVMAIRIHRFFLDIKKTLSAVEAQKIAATIAQGWVYPNVNVTHRKVLTQ